jgi:hypothetical protein
MGRALPIVESAEARRRVEEAEARYARGEISRQRLRQIRNAAEGRCVTCGVRSERKRCPEHEAAERAQARERAKTSKYRKRRSTLQKALRARRAVAEGREPGKHGAPRRPKKCGRCGGFGHNRRSCAERELTSKTLRFEIFERDGSLCAYCGRTPQEAIHGGAIDEGVHVTSCDTCVPFERAAQI